MRIDTSLHDASGARKVTPEADHWREYGTGAAGGKSSWAASELGAVMSAVSGANCEGTQTVGVLLRRRRRELGQDLGQIAQELCIREHYLAAIEEGHSEVLPGATYAIGFVRAYAEALGLNPAAVAERFRRENLQAGRNLELSFPSPLSEGGIPKGAMILVGTVIVSLVYGVWYLGASRGTDLVRLVNPLPSDYADAIRPKMTGGATTVTAQSRQGSAPGMPTAMMVAGVNGGPAPSSSSLPVSSTASAPVSLAPQDLAGEQGKPQPAAGTETARTEAEPAAASAEPSAPREAVAGAFDPMRLRPETGPLSARVVLRAKADCWIEIKDETSGKLIFARLLRANETYDVPDRPGLKLLVGNAGGIEVVVDKVTLPPLGREGAVMRNIVLEPERLRSATPAPRREG